MNRKEYEALAAEYAELREKITTLHQTEERTEEQDTELSEALDRAEAIKPDVEAYEARERKVEEIRAFAAQGRTEAGEDRGPQVVIKPSGAEVFDLTTVRAHPLADHRGYGTEMRDRAMRAVEFNKSELSPESQDRIDTLTRAAGRGRPGQHDTAADIARHIVLTGSDEYRDAFFDYLSGDSTAVNRVSSETRASMSLTGANGGFLVPFTLDPTIIITNAGATNPFRQIARQVAITTDDWNGVTSAGVTAEWLPESSESADASPTFAQPSITVHKASAYLQATLEVTQDSGIASEIAELIADAKARLEATAFATGTGNQQPVGIVTALALTTASRVAGSSGAAGAADLVAADIYALDNALGPRWRPNASFLANKTIWNSVRQLGTANLYHAFWTDFGGGLPPNLIGYPVYESSAMDSTIVSGSNDDVIILGDFRNYVVVDRIGLAIAYNPLVIGTNRRPIGEVGWFAYWRVGADSVNDDGFRELRL